MRRIRPDVMQLCPALVIEAMHQFGIAPQCFGRAHILDTMPFPKPIRPAQGGDSALCGTSSAGQDNAVANVRSDDHTSELKSLMGQSYTVYCLKNKNIQKHQSI